MEDPFVDNDPWMIRNAKGIAKPAPATVTFSDFLPPGFAQIEHKSESPKNEVISFGGPYTKEFEKIEEALEESLSDEDRRKLANERAISARVPWRRRDLSKMAEPSGIFKFGDESKEPIPKRMFTFGASYSECSCSRLQGNTFFTTKNHCNLQH